MTHIFVSHATADDDMVTRIHNTLEAATGRELWVDHKDIQPGDNWPHEIESHLAGCESMLLVMSRNAFDRDEVIAEWRDALLRNRRVYIAIIDDIPVTDIPSRLRLIQWVNLHDDWDGGLAALVASIKGEAMPADAPVHHPRPVTGHIEPRLTTIPMSGRDGDYAQLIDHLNSGRPTLILGVGGLGKSRLAAEIVLKHEGG